ncbi:hypothetical protein Rsub_03219 [Raphidocelis subcapitata]|uniref:Uncharacterized protein n=1 Tax=Raphidocelis subcapitata TaxID=307507 RepID=A0A2V0P0D4_9CHLO|nr:hypothetical protein Rsub_03219 [Raphidocelis subcapitata]|eukprot:GBF90647.1 hypothetical protein Rsub_03219 [Raphidocelis subcapitata]
MPRTVGLRSETRSLLSTWDASLLPAAFPPPPGAAAGTGTAAPGDPALLHEHTRRQRLRGAAAAQAAAEGLQRLELLLRDQRRCGAGPLAAPLAAVSAGAAVPLHTQLLPPLPAAGVAPRTESLAAVGTWLRQRRRQADAAAREYPLHPLPALPPPRARDQQQCGTALPRLAGAKSAAVPSPRAAAGSLGAQGTGACADAAGTPRIALGALSPGRLQPGLQQPQQQEQRERRVPQHLIKAPPAALEPEDSTWDPSAPDPALAAAAQPRPRRACGGGHAERRVQLLLRELREEPSARAALAHRLAAYRAAEAPARRARGGLLRTNREESNLTTEQRTALARAHAAARHAREERARTAAEQQRREAERAARLEARQREERRAARLAAAQGGTARAAAASGAEAAGSRERRRRGCEGDSGGPPSGAAAAAAAGEGSAAAEAAAGGGSTATADVAEGGGV